MGGNAGALKLLWRLTWRDAQTQTVADAFVALALCLALATATVPMLRRTALPTAAGKSR